MSYKFGYVPYRHNYKDVKTYITDRRTWKRNMQIARKGKFIPQVNRRMSKPMFQRQFALRKMAASNAPIAKNTLARIRSKAKYNLYKLTKSLKAKALLRRAVLALQRRMNLKKVGATDKEIDHIVQPFYRNTKKWWTK